MSVHPDAELQRLGRDLELLLRADAVLSECNDYDSRHSAHARAVKVMRAIHRLQPSTFEGVAVKLRALCFDFADFDRSKLTLKDGDVAEQQLGRLMMHVHQMAKRRARS